METYEMTAQEFKEDVKKNEEIIEIN